MNLKKPPNPKPPTLWRTQCCFFPSQAPAQSYRALFSKVKQFLPPLYRRNRIIQADSSGEDLLPFTLFPHRNADAGIAVVRSAVCLVLGECDIWFNVAFLRLLPQWVAGVRINKVSRNKSKGRWINPCRKDWAKSDTESLKRWVQNKICKRKIRYGER